MGIQDDRDEFNTTGLRGLLRKSMATSDEVFIKVTSGGHHGELLSQRPTPGSGPYLHYRRGYGVLEYRNATPQDAQTAPFRLEV